MNTLALAAAAVTFIATGRVIAADINQPVERPITVKSEVIRGLSAADDCWNHVDVSDWFQYSQCVFGTIRMETRNNRLSDAFQFGIYFRSTFNIHILEEEVDKGTLVRDPNFGKYYEFCQVRQAKYQKELDLSDADIAAILRAEAK